MDTLKQWRYTLKQLRLPRVKNSCCGCSLENGSLAVAIYNMFVVSFMFFCYFLDVKIFEYKKNIKQFEYIEDFKNGFYRNEFTFAMIISTFVFSLCLLYGVRKKDRMYMEPWLLMKCTVYMLNLVFLALMIYEMAYGKKEKIIFSTLIYLGIDSYMMTVVYSYYSELGGK